MQAFDVSVRNEFTGEVRVVQVSSCHEGDAQLLALHQLFEVEGWRKATAAPPSKLDPEADA